MQKQTNPNLRYTTFDGIEVLNLLPDNLERPAALVDLSALQRIITHLETVDLYTLKSRMCDKIMKADTTPEFITTMKDEIAFHNTVNIIRMVDLKEVKELIDDREVKTW